MTEQAGARATHVVEVSGLGTRLGGHWQLRNLDLTVGRGETVALIGESGGGKSLLLRQIIGLRRPDEGSVYVLGESIHDLEDNESRRIRRHWGVLFQQGALFSALSVYDNIAFPMRELRKDGAEIPHDMIDDLVRTKLKMVGLQPEVASKWPNELSGGMVKRAALARALALDAELLFLDEPTTGLDPAAAGDLDELYISLREDLALSGLVVTHDLSTLAAVADRVAVLVGGQILTSGTLEEVMAYDHPFTRQFFTPRHSAPRRPSEAC